MFSKIILMALASLGAYLLIRYRYKIQEVFGTISWAEKYLGSTEMGIVLLAALLFIGTLLHITGTADGILSNTFGRFF